MFLENKNVSFIKIVICPLYDTSSFPAAYLRLKRLIKKSIHEIAAPYITPNFIIRRTAVLTIGVQCTFCAKAAPMVIS